MKPGIFLPGWRWMFGSGVIPSIIFILLLLTVPESPRWLASQKKHSEAMAILKARSMVTQLQTGTRLY